MALPKLNHTQMPNYFIDNYMASVSGNATKIFLMICRNTIGWHKTTDRISQTQIKKMTGLAVNTIKAAIEDLLKYDLIKVERYGKGKGTQTYFELNYEIDEIKAEEKKKANMSNIDTKQPYVSKTDTFNMSKTDTLTPPNVSKIDTTKHNKEIINKGHEVLLKINEIIKDDPDSELRVIDDKIYIKYYYSKSIGFMPEVRDITYGTEYEDKIILEEET